MDSTGGSDIPATPNIDSAAAARAAAPDWCRVLVVNDDALERAQRHSHSLAVLTCEIDGPDWVTGRFGCEQGDQVLRTFVARAGSHLRQGDWLARTGGTEFMVVLPETTLSGAHCAARKLARLFEPQSRAAAAGQAGFRLTIDVTAIDGKYDVDGTLRVNTLVRNAARGGSAGDRAAPNVGSNQRRREIARGEVP